MKIYSAVEYVGMSKAIKAIETATPDFWPAQNRIAWLDHGSETFLTWLGEHKIGGILSWRGSSLRTYAAMFSTWSRYLGHKKLCLFEVSAPDVVNFFTSEIFKNKEQQLEPVSHRRYLQLLDKLYSYFVNSGLTRTNPIAEILMLHSGAISYEFPPGLSEVQVLRLVAKLEEIPGWKGARDRALAALLLGAGLRTGEVITLPNQAVNAHYEVLITHDIKKTVFRSHQTIILPDGPWRKWWDQWLTFRANELNPNCENAIFATSSGTPYSPSGLYRRIEHWLCLAEVMAPSGGPNLLRNTFARQAIDCGRYKIYEVKEFLGHHDERATARHIRGRTPP